MAEAKKTPWHLWVVGALSAFWNSVGVFDFMMTQTKNEAYMGQFTSEQLEYFYGFPLWVEIAWAIATWGSLTGSLLLLLRNKLAVQVNLAVLVAMAVTFIYNFALTDGLKIMGGAGPMLFTAVIIIVAILLWIYARASARRGALR